MKLALKQTLIVQPGLDLTIKSLIGEGAQGEVYLVEMNRKEYALKWYKKDPSHEFIQNLKDNIVKGAPSAEFIWPLYLVQNEHGVGYVMELIPPHFKSFVSLLNGKHPFYSLNALISWTIHLANAFKRLHSLGFSYQDVNDGGFFFEPQTGKLLICDNDNVTANQHNLGILGKMKYMAPEVVLKKNIPDIHSDRFSLAIILFLTLTMGHPFLGNRIKDYNFIDEKAEFELYGSNPLFVYAPNNPANRPIRGYHNLLLQRWETLPIYVQEEFIRSFTKGITERENERTTELEWIKVLFKYRDDLMRCQNCLFEFASGHTLSKPLTHCPKCHQEVPPKLILDLGRYRIALDLGKQLFEPHLDKFSPNYENVVGEIIANKNNPKLWGIRNLSSLTWSYQDSSGDKRQAAPQSVVPLIRNLTIHFSDDSRGTVQ